MASSRNQQGGHWAFPRFLLLSSLLSFVNSAPSVNDWNSLQQQLNGNLQSAHPLAYPCFPHPDGQNTTDLAAERVEVQENFLNASYRTSVYQGFFHTYNDGCVSNATDQCLLSPDDPFAAISGTCTQGLVSEYYIEVRGASDVQTAFAFAKRTGVALSIKASGHDYLGRSSINGSLALWTRNLKQMTFHPSFQPSGTQNNNPSGVQAITLGAGVNLDEVYFFADQNNVTFIGGSSPTVTAAGGWSLFGGHSVLSPLYGLGADRVLEITVVTPDGVLRTANRYTNPDLFWALRGAGGGAFGVVLSMTVKVEPAMPLTLAEILFDATPSNQLPFLELLIDQSVTWAADGWGGPMGSSYVALVHPGTLDLNDTAHTFSAVAEYAQRQQNGSSASINYLHFPTWYSFYKAVIAPSGAPGIGQPNFVHLKVMPKSAQLTASGRQGLVAYFKSLLDADLQLQILQTPPNLYEYEAGSTSVHSAWRDSFWMVGPSLQYAWNASEVERKGNATLLQQVSKEAPGGAVYPNESSPWVEDWESAYWGNGYARLLEVKKKYDPSGLINCWKCVGFQEGIRTDEEFGCWEAYAGLV